jgi:hypothetical protein
MKRILHTVLIFVASCTTSFAQIQLNHLDLSVTGGTTGLGFDLAAPINDKFRVRIGASFLPTHQKHMKFDTEVGDYNPALTPEQNAQQSAEKFQKLSSAFSGIAGETIDKEIDILGERSFNNFKLLVDYYPFKSNKHWHLTAGFYWGSSTFAKAYNTATCMTELMAVTMYNNMRKSAMAEEPLITYNNLSVYLPYTFNSDIVEYGDMSIVLGKYSHDIYAKEDILWDFDALDPISGAILHEKGDIRYAKGDLIHKAGDPYQMLPDEDNMVKVTAKTNSFRPYLGMGYETSLTKDKRTSISVNAGILLWGGSPEITTHEGINVKKDLMDLKGKFADNVNSLSHLNVYPVFTLRLTRRLF